jgi:hypothetical protein
MKKSLALILAFAFSQPVAGLSVAHASEWGCQVLLCAASQNPSWHSIAACRPPMLKLIACKFKTFGACPWPTCPEGGAGAPGFAKYADCPAGWEPSSTKGSGNRSQEAQLCVKRDVTCDTGLRKTGVSLITCIDMQTMPRALQSDPYYFDIKDDASGATERHFFNLRR